jgi:hypothetical protein
VAPLQLPDEAVSVDSALTVPEITGAETFTGRASALRAAVATPGVSAAPIVSSASAPTGPVIRKPHTPPLTFVGGGLLSTGLN